ncbi:MAG: hypothetical protein NC412_01750 [Roseburia sp.]|nr:hypothetical protein [Roseburia sp.]MCM1277981.1 hypothetical protein [Robinsoniella sp.]
MQQATNMNDWLCNLRELGCSDEMTMQIVDFVQNNDVNKATELLRRHKRVLLDELHNAENKVDLLDFLLYQLKKQKRKDDI